jgi:hypothetical protein
MQLHRLFTHASSAVRVSVGPSVSTIRHSKWIDGWGHSFDLSVYDDDSEGAAVAGDAYLAHSEVVGAWG